MKKRMFCFPKSQSRCLLYESKTTFESRLFSDLILQASPKNSPFFRFRNSYLGYLVGFLFKEEIQVPDIDDEYIGLKKDTKIVLFEMNGDQPVKVWRLSTDGSWVAEPFLGFQIISEYSVKELENKKTLIKKAFEAQKERNRKSGKNHGDFTHFNVLYKDNSEILFIDELNTQNSPLFDFFYFYSYFKQSIDRRKSLSEATKREMLAILENIINEVCIYDSEAEFRKDYESLFIPEISGILEKNKSKYVSEFSNIFVFD